MVAGHFASLTEGSASVGAVAQEYQTVGARFLGAVAIAGFAEFLQRVGRVDAILDDPGGHLAPGAFRHEAEYAEVAAGRLILEHGCDDVGLERFAVYRLEIFIGSEIHQQLALLRLRGQILVEGFGKPRSPEIVKAGMPVDRNLPSHFQAVWLDQVERAQHAVQSGQDAQVLLREVQLRGAEALGLQAEIDIAAEGEHRLARVAQGEWRLPRRVTLPVEFRQVGVDVHQVRQIVGVERLHVFDQARGIVQKTGLGKLAGAYPAFEVEGFGGRNYGQHKGRLSVINLSPVNDTRACELGPSGLVIGFDPSRPGGAADAVSPALNF